MDVVGTRGGGGQHRRRSRVVVAIIAATGAAGALLVASGSRLVDIPDQGPWLIVVAADPVHYPRCLDDEVIAMTIQTASAPSTGVSLRLSEEAARGDVARVVRCLTDRVAPSLIGVGTDAGRAWPFLEGAAG